MKKQNNICQNLISSFISKYFAEKLLPNQTCWRKIGRIGLVTIIAAMITAETACIRNPASMENKPEIDISQSVDQQTTTPQENTTRNDHFNEDDQSLILESQATVSEEKIISVDFEFRNRDFRLATGYDVNQLMLEDAKQYGEEYPYQYYAFIEDHYRAWFAYPGKYKWALTGVTFLEKFESYGDGLSVAEPRLFNTVFESQTFSENSQEGTYQSVIYVTNETGEDGKERNGFFSYSEGGLAFYINEDLGSSDFSKEGIRIWKGNNINLNNFTVEEASIIKTLFEQGYTQVRKINDKLVGMFPINELPK